MGLQGAPFELRAAVPTWEDFTKTHRSFKKQLTMGPRGGKIQANKFITYLKATRMSRIGKLSAALSLFHFIKKEKSVW